MVIDPRGATPLGDSTVKLTLGALLGTPYIVPISLDSWNLADL